MGSNRAEYSSFEAKAHLSEILRKVEAGEQIAITKRGKRVALLVPYSAPSHDKQTRILNRFRQVRTRIAGKGRVNIKELINDGRKG